jgi:mannose-6-phosphate isomerase-like protein (cupin superfamily)
MRTAVLERSALLALAFSAGLAVASLAPSAPGEARYVYPLNNLKRYSFPTHTNDLVIDRAESVTSEVIIVVLKPGEAPPLHKHDDTEQVFYVIEGHGTLTIGKEGKTFPVRTGDVVRIPPSTWHKIIAEGGRTMRYLGVDCFVGGRPKAEPTWDSHVRVMCKQNGWDFNKVTGKTGSAPRR